MKKLLSALLLGGLLSAGGCSDKNYYYDIEGVEYLDFVYENVVRSEWSAYESLDRYELFISEPFITTRHYENGLSNAYVWIVEEGDEVRKQLPYSYTAYYHGVPYLLTIDYDIVVGEVGFFVHCFPEMAPRSLLPGSVDLKLSLIWENR